MTRWSLFLQTLSLLHHFLGLYSLLRGHDVTHIACAFDHVIESFRNDLYAGYKTGVGVPDDLMSQFDLAERTAAALGIVVWPMVEFEADDAIATAASRWWDAPGVEQVVICSPDKDFTQLVRGDRVVCLDRLRRITLDEGGVRSKFGVSPQSVPDYLALVGDSADGIPGVPRWGPKSSAEVLRRYRTIGRIPADSSKWEVEPRGAVAMAASLAEHREEAGLYKTLTTLRLDVPLEEALDELQWQGVRQRDLQSLCDELGFQGLMSTAPEAPS